MCLYIHSHIFPISVRIINLLNFVCIKFLTTTTHTHAHTLLALHTRNREVCAISKPGGLGLHARTIVQAAHLAHARAEQLHHRLEAAIAELEQLVLVKREQKLETMRKFRALQEEQRQKKLFLNRRQQDSAGEMDVDAPSTASAAAATAAGITGIDRSDPILQWSKLHEAAGLWEH